jgi:hypothetical protein
VSEAPDLYPFALEASGLSAATFDAELNQPNWHRRVTSWESFVPGILRESWDILGTDMRLAIFLVALDAASRNDGE